MPRRAKKPYPNPLPSDLRARPSSKSSTNELSYDDWSAKNARAKALIMSTIAPGSEAWKIAEPLEYAADIWKALEAKYGPKDGTAAENWESGEGGSKSDDELEKEFLFDSKSQEDEAYDAANSSYAVEASIKAEQGETKRDNPLSHDIKIDLGRRDKRFLWALLNGGKDRLDSVTIKTGQQLCGP